MSQVVHGNHGGLVRDVIIASGHLAQDKLCMFD